MIKKLKSYKLKDYNFFLVILIIGITVLGILLIDSAAINENYDKKQTLGLILGVGAMIFMSLFDYKLIMKFYWLIYIFNIVLLLSVLVLGRSAKGAKRWITFGGENSGLSLQPSEFCKIFLIVFLAKFLSVYQKKINSLIFLLIFAAVAGFPLLLVVVEPDLSTTLILSLIVVTLVYMAGIKYRIIGIILAILIPIVAGSVIYIMQPNQKLLKKYQKKRIMAFLDPANYADDRYQQDNSVLAIGSGKLNGKGLKNDDPGSVKNAGYIPEPQTDFISAILGEELGFIGCSVVLLLLFLIIIQCIITGIRASDFAGRLMCYGVASWLTYQTFVNIGVATEMLPNTGVTLPFVSYGLSSLIALFGSMGIVLNVGLQRKKD